MARLASPWRVVRIRGAPDRLDLGDGHRRQAAEEDQEQGEEQTERAGEQRDVPDRRAEVTPARRGVVAVEARPDDDAALEPRAEVAADSVDADRDRVGADRRAPGPVREGRVAAEHRPVGPGVWPERA